MSNLHEVLEICLQEIERGADIDTVLFRYPEFADELRPILEASVGARSMAVPAPSVEVVRRNRLKVLRHAAQLREAKAKWSARRTWLVSLRRVAVTLVVVAALFVSGTTLVRAASTTLPGDNLYPVKRTWEEVLLLFTFNVQQRDALEVEHENERLHELQELFAEGRSAEVEFAGLVTAQNGNEWVVSGIPVVISAQTEIRDQEIVIGSAVRVKGHTQGNVAVVAERIELLPPGAQLPDVNEHEGEERQGQDGSGNELQEDAPKIEETKTPELESEQKNESLDSGSDRSSDSGSQDGGSSGSSDGSHDSSSDSGGDHSSDPGEEEH